MNLIIGAAYGYSYEAVKPFLESLRKWVEDYRLILLVTSDCPLNWIDNIQKDKRIDLYHSQDRRIYRISRWLSARPTLAGVLALACRRKARRSGGRRFSGGYRLHHFTHIALARYLHARHLLSSDKFSCDRVLLTDVRDVVFQSDPFKLVDSELHTGLENKAIKETTSNSWWIDRLVHDWRRIETIREQTIICSGVTIGARAAMLEYLDMMAHEIIETLPVHAFEFGGQFGFDQGIHNYLLRGVHGLPLRLEKNGESRLLATLDNSRLDEFVRNQNGELCNREGLPVAIVHQYDRHECLVRRFAEGSNLHSANGVSCAKSG